MLMDDWNTVKVLRLMMKMQHQETVKRQTVGTGKSCSLNMSSWRRRSGEQTGRRRRSGRMLGCSCCRRPCSGEKGPLLMRVLKMVLSGVQSLCPHFSCCQMNLETEEP